MYRNTAEAFERRNPLARERRLTDFMYALLNQWSYYVVLDIVRESAFHRKEAKTSKKSPSLLQGYFH